jgi:hypothetical protein
MPDSSLGFRGYFLAVWSFIYVPDVKVPDLKACVEQAK